MDLPSDLPAERNLFLSGYGVRAKGGWHGYRRGRITDLLYDARLWLMPGYRRLRADARTAPIRRIHIAAVDVPARTADLHALVDRLSQTRHQVSASIAPMGDRGKFENLNTALQGLDPASIDWLVVTDDDIAVPDRFLDTFIQACEAADLAVAMPAHRFHSHAAWIVTQRHRGSLVRKTRFVECGPLTAFRSDVLPHVLPFPVTRWAWGLDLLWAEAAARNGHAAGVVDATPIEHLRPIAMSYDRIAAETEALELMQSNGIVPDNREYLRTVACYDRLPRGRAA